jgi:uncharacterized protein (DUF697 family)
VEQDSALSAANILDPAETAALKAENIIKKHIIGAMAAGLIPFPIVDVAGVALLEVNMITELAAAYNFPVPRALVVYKLLISLAGAVGPVFFSLYFRNSVKALPLVGHAIYLGAFSLSGAISVYAVGKLFQKHFESGGTFLSSKNAVIRKFFAEKEAEGRTAVPALIAASPVTPASA